MKTTSINILDDNDLEIIDIMKSLGMPRNLAIMVTYLTSAETEATSVDIEKASHLRQPEVSIATRKLRAMGWITEKDVKKTGKGRPFKTYALTVSIEDIMEHLEAQLKIRNHKGEEAIDRLKKIWKIN